MEFSDEGIEAARNGLLHLQNQVRQVVGAGVGNDNDISMEYKDKFLAAVNDDLNMPRAMAVVQEMLKSSIGDRQKLTTILDFNRVLGLNLDQLDQEQALPEAVQKRVAARIKARKEKDFSTSDRLRAEIEAMGYLVQDTKDGMKVIKK
jgi:cysteinyl-tRNA synthetase